MPIKTVKKVWLLTNILYLALVLLAFITIDWWFLKAGNFDDAKIISTRAFILPFFLISMFAVIANVGCIYRIRPSNVFLIITLVSFFLIILFWGSLKFDRIATHKAIAYLTNKEIYFCKYYAEGTGKSRTNLYYYSTSQDYCETLILEAPHYRKDFDKAKDVQKRLNS